jgi:hypothetical protein
MRSPDTRLWVHPGRQLVIGTGRLFGLLPAGKCNIFALASNLWGIPKFFVHGHSQGGDSVAVARGDGAL